MKKKTYLVLDTETATLDFADELAQGDAEKKKKLAIARPLIYDIGWTICDRQGAIVKKTQYLISEIFSVPAIFNTAYYASKRPIYIDMLAKGETSIKPWREVMTELIADMGAVDAVGAFNSMFDFKKAIPFTELYINKLYSADYYNWYEEQKRICAFIITHPYEKPEDKEFDPNNFLFHGVNYPLFDIWGLATIHLLDRVSYREECIKRGLLTASGIYFKSSAESTYQYLAKKYSFVEAHTALDDATIETYILSKIATRHKVSIGIKYFPFRDLGYTTDFVLNRPRLNIDYVHTVRDAIQTYIDAQTKVTTYVKSLISKVATLDAILAAV